jgi:hypothetical protein
MCFDKLIKSKKKKHTKTYKILREKKCVAISINNTLYMLLRGLFIDYTAMCCN